MDTSGGKMLCTARRGCLTYALAGCRQDLTLGVWKTPSITETVQVVALIFP